MAALFTIAKIWNQPKCPSTDEWIKTLHIHAMDCYSSIKKYEVLPFAAMWMDLEDIMLSEGAFLVAQAVKDQPAMQKTPVQSPGQEDPMEKGMAPHSSILAWRIPWTEEPGRLQSMQRVGHDRATNTLYMLSEISQTKKDTV